MCEKFRYSQPRNNILQIAILFKVTLPMIIYYTLETFVAIFLFIPFKKYDHLLSYPEPSLKVTFEQ